MSFIDFSDFDVNSDDLQDTQSFDLLPQGWYQGFVEKIEARETRTGGQMFAVTVQITGPSHAGRKVFVNFNWVNANPTAQQIGRQQFAGLVRAVGLQQVTSLEDVTNRPFDCKVGVQKSRDPQYEDRNDIKQYAVYGSKTQEQVAATVVRKPAPQQPTAPRAPNPQRPAQAAPAQAAPTRKQVETKRGAMPWERATTDANGFNPADDDIPF
nr:MAG TPA: Protein of unknown function (DUF669) [Caudoviricetes sp.]